MTPDGAADGDLVAAAFGYLPADADVLRVEEILRALLGNDARVRVDLVYAPTPIVEATVPERAYRFVTSPPSNESSAHIERWKIGTVTELQAEAGVFLIKGDDDYHKPTWRAWPC